MERVSCERTNAHTGTGSTIKMYTVHSIVTMLNPPYFSSSCTWLHLYIITKGGEVKAKLTDFYGQFWCSSAGQQWIYCAPTNYTFNRFTILHSDIPYKTVQHVLAVWEGKWHCMCHSISFWTILSLKQRINKSDFYYEWCIRSNFQERVCRSPMDARACNPMDTQCYEAIARVV